MIGKGEIATMSLGSWAIVQMPEKATDPADIGYLPFPVHVGGKFHAVSQLSARATWKPPSPLLRPGRR